MSNLSDSDRRLIVARVRFLRKRGEPQEASVLQSCLDNDTHPPANLMGKTGFNPEKAIAVPLQDLEVPPRAGRGASKQRWAEFALTVADIEPQIVEALERDEIIGLLEARGVIDGEGEIIVADADGTEDEAEVEVEAEDDAEDDATSFEVEGEPGDDDDESHTDEDDSDSDSDPDPDEDE